MHLATESLRPSARRRRYRNSVDGISVYDGPFVETKELIAGYAIGSAGSLGDAGRIAERSLVAVARDGFDVRELDDPFVAG